MTKINSDERRAMKIVAYEYNLDNIDIRTLDKLMREYSETVKGKTIYPLPIQIADNFIDWLKNKKQIIVTKRINIIDV